MEEGTANPKPSWQQSAYSSANAVAEPGQHVTNYAIDDLTNLPLPENGLASHVDYGIYSSALDSLATSGDHNYANSWVTTHPQDHAFAPLVDPSPSQSAESTFPAGAAYNAGIAFPNGHGHYIWVPEVAAGPMDQYANTNFQYLDPSFSATRPYAAGITGNGHAGQLQTNGLGTQMSAAGAFSNASYAANNGNSYGGQFPVPGFPTQLMAPNANPSGFHAIDSGNVSGGQLPANDFDTPLMARDAYPSAFRAIDSSHVHAGQFPASGFQNGPSTAVELPNAPPAVDDSDAPLGAAHVAPARHTCVECKTPFKRKGELKRHAKKHQADSKNFRCVVAGCGYNSYRKDKLADHIKHRHAVTASAST